MTPMCAVPSDSEPNRGDRLRLALARGPILLDAAMGTRLISRGLDLSTDDPALWNLDRPDVVEAIHRLDIEAGADAVTTNTFGANRTWLARHDRAGAVEAINRSAVALARSAAGADRIVLGCLGPTAEPDADREQAALLTDSGVDALILETILHVTTDHMAGRLQALRSVSNLPFLLGFATVDQAMTAHRSLDPSTIGLVALGWNCVPLGRIIDRLNADHEPSSLALMVQPSGSWMADASSTERDLNHLVSWLLQFGVRLFGGCCGTTEHDIAALRAALGPSPHRPSRGTPSWCRWPE